MNAPPPTPSSFPGALGASSVRAATRSRGRVLFAEDEDDVRGAIARILRREGYETVLASDGVEARSLLATVRVDAVVSDIMMPGLDGFALLEAVRQKDVDIPVIFVTGKPDLQTAMRAVEYGAMRYLTKPLDPRALLDVVDMAVRSRRSKAIRGPTEPSAPRPVPITDADLNEALSAALTELHLAFQPIVSWREKRVVAYEALMRTREKRLPSPPAILDAAERLGRLPELGRRVRELAALAIVDLADDLRLFVNIHPSDLDDDYLYRVDMPLSRFARRVTIEVTERKALSDGPTARRHLHALRMLGYAVAVDDLGAGYAGLTSFAMLSPEVVKIDMSLVRGIDQNPVTQRIIRSVVTLCRDMRVNLVAEGVETVAERDTLLALGCDLLQGYFFGRPAPTFLPVSAASMGAAP